MCKIAIGDSIFWGYPRTLHHFCSMQSFMNIMSYKTIRLSEVTKSNDKKEVRLFYDIIFNKSMAFLDEITQVTSYSEIESYRKRLRIALNNDFSFLSFAFCMSTQSNSLSQWTRYADDAQGIAIGFDSECLQRLFVHLQNNIVWDTYDRLGKEDRKDILKIELTELEQDRKKYFSKSSLREDGAEYMLNMVIYSLDPVAHVLEDYFNQLRSKYFHKLEDEAEVDKLLLALHDGLVKLLNEYAINMKHQGFEEEQEWRAVINGPSHVAEMRTKGLQQSFISELFRPNENLSGFHRKPMCFKDKQSLVVGYVDVCFEEYMNDIIKKISLGPKCKSSVRDIEILLQAYGYNLDCIEILKVDIPYQ